MKLFLLRATFIRFKFQHRFYFYYYCYDCQRQKVTRPGHAETSGPAPSLWFGVWGLVNISNIYEYCWGLCLRRICKTLCSKLNWLKRKTRNENILLPTVSLAYAAGMLVRGIPYTNVECGVFRHTSMYLILAWFRL